MKVIKTDEVIWSIRLKNAVSELTTASNLSCSLYIILDFSTNFNVVSLFRKKTKKWRKSQRKERNLLKKRRINLHYLNGKSRIC
jgi:hypothetical protein